MSDDDAQEPMFPFGNIPFLNDMMKAMASQGPLNWELAAQAAAAAARGATPDTDTDPATRIAYNRLADIADMHVRQITGLPTGPNDTHTEILTTTRALWAHRTLTDLRPLFTDLAAALTRPQQGDQGDPMSAMIAQMSAFLFPTLMGITVGSMIGSLAQRAFGQYDLPLARPHTSEILVVAASVESFASDWSIPPDDLRMWVLTHELTSHAVLATPAVTDGLMESVKRHVGSFRPDPAAFMSAMGDIDPSDPAALETLQRTLGDPMTIVGAMRSPEQEALAPFLDARVAAVTGYIDHVVDAVGSRILGNASPIAEAVRRRRLDGRTDADLAEKLLGVSLPRALQRRGAEFVSGVIERAGEDPLRGMLSSAERLPTPNELDAPGLWLARLGID
ncbi:MAG: zinc-dependent metalloprotease [Ilumatobacteraceae bacterium]